MITLVSVLQKYYAAHNCIKLCFKMNDVGGGNISKQFTWFVCDDQGNRLQQKDNKKRPKLNEEFCISIPLAKCNLENTIPYCTSSVSIDTKFQIGLRVHYGEIHFDSNTCLSTILPKTQTSIFYALNAALNSWNINKFIFAANQTGTVLSSRPKVWTICKGGLDYLYYFGIGTATLTFYKNGSPIFTTVKQFTEANKSQYISLDPVCHGVTDCVQMIQVSVNDGAKTTIYKIKVKDCCCNDYYGILFLEPCGGRSLFPACMESAQLNRTGTETCKSFICNDETQYSGHNSMINVQARRERTFRVQLEKNLETLEYVETFFSASGHHLQRGTGTTARLEKFVLSAGSYTVFGKEGIVEVEFTGYLSENINSQQEDV